MKYLILGAFLSLNLALSAQESSAAQDTVLIVNGVCGMCQKTIEKAAKLPGVEKAHWDKNTKILSLRYQSSRLSLSQISQSIAEAGYDTELMTAPDSAYQGLHDCCLYRDPQTHADHQ